MQSLFFWLIHLGDYVDRGPESAQVVEWLLAGPPVPGATCVNLMGNHEEMMLSAVAATDQGPASHWLTNGGADALMVETCQDLLQIKCALAAAQQTADAAALRFKAGDLSAQDRVRVEIEAERARSDQAKARAEVQRGAAALAQAPASALNSLKRTDIWAGG